MYHVARIRVSPGQIAVCLFLLNNRNQDRDLFTTCLFCEFAAFSFYIDRLEDGEFRPSTTDDPLFDNMLPGDILRYSRASKEAHASASSYLRRRFRIESVLRKYFEVGEIRKFRELQYATGMIISGSTVVQFFDRSGFSDSDLDCYVEHRYRWKVAEWLLNIGYEYVERPIWSAMPGDDEENETLEEILERVSDEEGSPADFLGPQVPRGYFGAAILLNFEKRDPIRKIQVITCHYAPLQMILNFHSSARLVFFYSLRT